MLEAGGMSGSVHLMGIGGTGMSALARWYLHLGWRVSGCDLSEGEETGRLSSLGIEVRKGHNPDHLKGIDCLVFSAAVPSDNPELRAAREEGITVLRRSEALAELTAGSETAAISGAHGKTTTTALIGWILQSAGMDPLVMAGGSSVAWDGNFRAGDGPRVVEADEYDRAFLRLTPKWSCVTSFDREHLECYGNEEVLSTAFSIFLEMTLPGGGIVVPEDRKGLAYWAERLERKVVTTGRGGDLHCASRGPSDWGELYEVARHSGRIPLPGAHNLRNCESAFAVCGLIGVPIGECVRSVESFPGVSRRLERLKGEGDGERLLISDYAHHPAEMESAIRAVQRMDRGEVGVVFQPHLYSRTAALSEQMGKALSLADWSLVLPIFPAREEPVPGIDNRLVANAARRLGARCQTCTEEELAEKLASLRSRVVIFMGAGSVDAMARRLVEESV
ncbi:UDP-N-acetylmuramate--L-alanine ligase [Candidatus Fermentibacteria bacterium]|nr:UDP-N-acetylmuramate--L-alanine ligase [Candidatus Fermentibacteria bacterium]